VVLLEGFTISHLKLGDIILEKVYLKWDNRLHLQVSSIDLSGIKSNNEPIDLEPFKKLPTYIKWAETWTDSINVDNIVYDDFNGSVHYTKNKIGTLQLHKGKISLSGDFTLTPDTFHSDLITPQSNLIYADSNITIDIPNQRFSIATSLTVAQTPKLEVLIQGDTKKIALSLRADSPFKRIDNLINTIGLDPDIQPWIKDYLKFKDATLEKCDVDFDYNEDPLHKLIIRASVHNATYTFAQGVAPIYAPTVNLVLKDKKLYITPINATLNALPLERSSLNFDFTTPDTLLNIHILTAHAQLNDSLLNLLKHYNISIPLRQNNGFTAVDMNFNLNLSTLAMKVKGNFIPTASTFDLNNFIVQSNGGKVTLNDSNVNFSGFHITHNKYGKADISGVFSGNNNSGQIHIHPTYFTPQDEISLLPLPSSVTLHLSPTRNILEVPPTQWKAFDEIIHFDAFKTSVDLTNVSLILPAIQFSILNKTSGNISGKYSNNLLNLNLFLDQVNILDTQLMSTPLTLSVHSDGTDVNISSQLSSTWNTHQQKVSLSPFSLQVHQSNLAIMDAHIVIDTLFSSNFNGNYGFKNKTGTFHLSKTTIIDPKIAQYLTFKSPQTLDVDFSHTFPQFTLSQLATTIKKSNEGWTVDINDLSSLSSSIPLLNQYDINNGTLSLLYAPDTNKTTFNGTVKYPYKLIRINNNMITNYTFKGSYQNKILKADINDQLHLTYDHSLVLKTNNIGINLPEAVRWIDNHSSDTNKTITNSSDNNAKTNPDITFYGKNSYIYLADKRQIPSDTLNATFNGDDGYASLTYGEGTAKMTMKNGLFYIEGANFNNQFMEDIFAYSDFIGGKFSFTIKGQENSYEGLIHIEKVTMKQFKLLTNILAFTNTISTLTSFSLPNYNQKGLFVNELYTHFNYADNILTADTFVLDSPEIQMGGNFETNIQDDTIKGEMTLKSNIGRIIGHIPIVGYLLLGKDGGLSTTVNLSGKANDPTIDTGVAKELVVAPYNILKRTVTYPFGWILNDGKKK
jgi:hypothetical protein